MLVLKPHGAEEDDEDCIVVNASPYCVGRRPDNDAQIPSPDVSGKHAVLRFDRGNWWVVDNRSTNGTFVNGKRINDASALSVGDILHFATRGYQVVPEVAPAKRVSSPTKVLSDSAEIKGTLDLVHIINQQKTFPHFQPIVNLSTKEILGWESLGRALASDGPVTAGPLYWLAGRNKVEVPLSSRFRESATLCASCRHCWRNSRREALFLNLHPAEIRGNGFIDILDELAQSELSQHYQLALEVPESLVCNTQEMQTLVREIHRRKMFVAYDDFGRGQSRLADLITVPPDFLKLDRELISSLGANYVKHGLVKAIVDACGELQVRTIGEGIETREELAVCMEMGIEFGQGFLLAPPAPAFQLFDATIAGMPSHCPFVQLNLLGTK